MQVQVAGLLAHYLNNHDLGHLEQVDVDAGAFNEAYAEAKEQHPEENHDELTARANFRLIWKEHGVPKPDDSVKSGDAPEYVTGKRVVEIQQAAKDIHQNVLPEIKAALLEGNSQGAEIRNSIERMHGNMVIKLDLSSKEAKVARSESQDLYSLGLIKVRGDLNRCVRWLKFIFHAAIALIVLVVVLIALSIRAHAQIDGLRVTDNSDGTVKQWAGGIAKLKCGSGMTCSLSSGIVTLATSAGSGTGDFVGPSSSTDNAVVRFDGTTGKLGQNSGVTIDDSGNLTATSFIGPVTGNASTATALAANGTNCSAGTYARGVDASGNAENCSGDTSGNATTATALAANPADCAAGRYAISIVANGDLTCGQVAAADVSGLAASATTNTTSASNITSGTLPVAQLPSGVTRKYCMGTNGSTVTSVSGSDVVLASCTITGGDISTVNTELEVDYCFQHTTNSASTQYKMKYSTFSINLQSSTGAGVMCGRVLLYEITDTGHQMMCAEYMGNGTSIVSTICDTTGAIAASSNQTFGLYANAASNTDIYTLKIWRVRITTN